MPCGVASFRFFNVSVQEINEKLATLPRKEQDEVIAFLFHPRQADAADYRAGSSRGLQDKDFSHWLSPDEFERKLDKKESR